MRAAIVLVLLLLLPFAAVAEEERQAPAKKDPVKALPKCLQPGVDVVYDRAAAGKTLAGTVTYRTEKGAADGTVKITLEYDTGDRGVLTHRDRIEALLHAESKLLLFTYSVGAKKDEPYVKAAALKQEFTKEGVTRLVHERYTYRKKDEKPRVKRTRVKADDAWLPDRLEPFLVALHATSQTEPFTLKLMTVLTGTIARNAVQYRPLGEGTMRIGEKNVDCRILSRVRGDERATLYLRTTDSLPLKDSAAGLTVRPPRKKPTTEKKTK